MDKLLKYLFTKMYLIIFCAFTFILIVTSYALSVWFYSFGDFIQIILFTLFFILFVYFFFAFYLSIKKQKISYFLNASSALFICIIAAIISNNQFGEVITNQLLGSPKTTALFRSAQLNLRDNNSFDICYESSFIKLKEIFSGTYQIKNNEILFYYKNSIPKGCSKKAKFEEDDRVIRFYDANGKHLFPFYTY